MVNKRKLHHYWKNVRVIKVWQLLFILFAMSWFSLWAYSQNSRNVVPLVQKLLAADEAGEGVDEALREVGTYMTNHMNSQIGSPIRLENTFYRAYEKALEESQPTSNGEVYRRAQRVCEDPNILLSERALCIQDYVLKNAPPGQEAVDPNLPRPEDYTYSFATPLWSPDLAGWSIAATVTVGVILFARIIAGWLVVRTLKRHL